MSPSTEQQILAALQNLTDEQRAMRDALFGSDYASGRLPQIEAAIQGINAVQASNSERIGLLETARSSALAVGNTVLAIVVKGAATVVGMLYAAYLLLQIRKTL